MSTTTKWLLPCIFDIEKYDNLPVSFDLTKHLKVILKNEVWKREIVYGSKISLQNVNIENIKSAKITIYPRFAKGIKYEKRLLKIIQKECGRIPAYLKVNNYKAWDDNLGCAVINIDYINEIDSIPSREDINSEIPIFTAQFSEDYNSKISVLKELSAFFLAALHLTFPSEFSMGYSPDPINDGICLIKSKKSQYVHKYNGNTYMHMVLIETNKFDVFENNLDALSTIWHFNLWPIKRYLIAVESNVLSMDNLLDLIYALEGLFNKNTSAEMIRLICIVKLTNTKQNAQDCKAILTEAFKIRNDIAHGEKTYMYNDAIKINGRAIPVEKIYWIMKGIVAQMIVFAINKLRATPGMTNLRFTGDDIIEEIINSKKNNLKEANHISWKII